MSLLSPAREKCEPFGLRATPNPPPEIQPRWQFGRCRCRASQPEVSGMGVDWRGRASQRRTSLVIQPPFCLRTRKVPLLRGVGCGVGQCPRQPPRHRYSTAAGIRPAAVTATAPPPPQPTPTPQEAELRKYKVVTLLARRRPCSYFSRVSEEKVMRHERNTSRAARLACSRRVWLRVRWQRLQSRISGFYYQRVTVPVQFWVACGRPPGFRPRLPWWQPYVFAWLSVTGWVRVPRRRRHE